MLSPLRSACSLLMDRRFVAPVNALIAMAESRRPGDSACTESVSASVSHMIVADLNSALAAELLKNHSDERDNYSRRSKLEHSNSRKATNSFKSRNLEPEGFSYSTSHGHARPSERSMDSLVEAA